MGRAIPAAIMFASGFTVMAAELCAARYVNLSVGPSIYSWTTLIAVVLAGMSLGNVLGGLIAQRTRDLRRSLGLLLLCEATVLIFLRHIPPLLNSSLQFLESAPWGVQVASWVIGLMLGPSLVFGTVSPLVTELALRQNPERSGAALGAIAAAGTWGALLGTFLTGFRLIGWMGTGGVLLGLAAILGIVAYGLLRAHHVPLGRLAYGCLILAIAALLPIAGRAEVIRKGALAEARIIEGDALVLLEESNYFTIRIRSDRTTDDKLRLSMLLDNMVHGFLVPSQPGRLEYQYEHVYAWATDRHAAARPDPNAPIATFSIGGGTYTFPRWLAAEYPGSEVLVAEIDPRVRDVNEAFLHLPADGSIRTLADDARRALLLQPEGAFDIVYGDAFNGFSVPWHLTTLEYTRAVAARLKSDGLYCLNFIDLWQDGHPETSRFGGAMVRTVSEVFGADHVYLFASAGRQVVPQDPMRVTWVLVCVKGDPADYADLGFRAEDRAFLIQEEASHPYAFSPAQQQALAERGILLTDDYAPVDQLLAGAAASHRLF